MDSFMVWTPVWTSNFHTNKFQSIKFRLSSALWISIISGNAFITILAFVRMSALKPFSAFSKLLSKTLDVIGEFLKFPKTYIRFNFARKQSNKRKNDDT